MIDGLMQDVPLSTTSIILYAAQAHGAREVVSRTMEGGIIRMGYAESYHRCIQAANALRALGVGAGDRVATLAWNTHRHFELFYAVPGLGAILHTVNPRLFDEQIKFIINHGGATVLLADGDLASIVVRLAPGLPNLRHCILLSETADAPPETIDWPRYETLIAAEPAKIDWPTISENAGANLCYTSGTTGDPKGVLYSHRSIVLHAMGVSLNGAFGYRADDCVMPAASLYHGTGWAIPYTSPLNGTKLVLPANKLDGASLDDLIEAEGVTYSSGVPTIWTNYLNCLAARNAGPGTLKRLVVGGSALPISMAETFLRDYGVTVTQAWGMTETSPVGVISTPSPALDDMSDKDRQNLLWTRQGRLQFGIELRIINDDGDEVPHDGQTPGAIQVRGPWVVRRYFGQTSDVCDAQGWLDTGDVGTMDSNGFLRLTDRSKDLIKSGGEWISSIELETLAEGCEGVRYAAVIGIPHPRWEERPLLIVEAHEGAQISGDDILAYLDGRIARWWRPEGVVFVDRMPLTATGKLDKRSLRARFPTYDLTRFTDNSPESPTENENKASV